jgi:UDP-N-acetylmuramate dehydrogenase
MTFPATVERDSPLAPLTTLGVGGSARFLARVKSVDELASLLKTARDAEVAVEILGGGSNVLVSDSGYDGLVIIFEGAEVEQHLGDDYVELSVQAGMHWDTLVSRTVFRGLAGLECLSGIPGNVGAAPIQNVGAYGQEVSKNIARVHTLERDTGQVRVFTEDECGFSYRQSLFKGAWQGRFVITKVDFRLRPDGAPTIRYPELERRLVRAKHPRLSDVRHTVLAIRREKSMVYNRKDPNHRSAGSFFLNPIVNADQVEAVRACVSQSDAAKMPAYPTDDGRVKLSAAWLIERAGFQKGFTQGRAGLSTRHCLAIINRGEATADDLLALASTVRRGVHDALGVLLNVEPRLLGFDRSVDELLV